MVDCLSIVGGDGGRWVLRGRREDMRQREVEMRGMRSGTRGPQTSWARFRSRRKAVVRWTRLDSLMRSGGLAWFVCAFEKLTARYEGSDGRRGVAID